MTAVRIMSATVSTAPGDVLVVVGRRVADGLRLAVPADSLGSAASDTLLDAVSALDPAPKECVRVPGSVVGRDGIVVVAPVPETAEPSGPNATELLRRAVGAALRDMSGATSAAVVPPAGDDATIRAVAEGAALGAYRFHRYRSGTVPAGPDRVTLAVPGQVSRQQRALVKDAAVVAEAVGLVRDLVNTPPNDLGPADFARTAATAFEGSGVTVKIWDDKALRRGGFGGLTAVGQGSERGPRLVRLTYRPRRARTTVALVGKGITFDSGGLSLKPPKAMETMKCDMAGAAAVLATVKAAATLRLPVNVTGWLALAENLPSGTAQRPGDVITIHGGTTVEVLNTDAEGRLVLADGLVAAAAEHPDLLVDVATLTGAQMIALGTRVAGVMGNDDGLRDEIVAAGGTAGESLWPMPLPEELRASLDSPVADLANIGERNGGMLTAALFLRDFVPDDLPWAHLDIAGPAFNEGGPHGYTPRGATGFGVRTLTQFLRVQADAPR